MTLQITTKSSKLTTVHLVLNGTLDAITAPELDQFVSDNLSSDIITLVLDLQTLSFVSSAGLRILAKIRKKMKSREGKIYFVNLSPQVKKVFEIVKAVPISEVFLSTEELDTYLTTMQEKVAREVDG